MPAETLGAQCESLAQTKAKMTAKLAESEGARDASERMIALGRLGDAHEVARAIEFLLHPDSCYITGAHARSPSCMCSVGCICAILRTVVILSEKSLTLMC